MGGYRVLVLFGGRSSEHEVSVRSARRVADALEELGHTCVGVGITLEGRWIQVDPRRVADRVPAEGQPYDFVVSAGAARAADLAFPVLHGPYGEDGCVQGLLELADLPYVGTGVEGSAVCMNKVLQKRLFVEACLPVVDFVPFARREWEGDAASITERVARLGQPCFVKPARLGSSLGISKVSSADELPAAVRRALMHDDLVLAEAQGGPREIEVGVLDGDPPELSVPGEVVATAEFYDYAAKYGQGGAELQVPVDLPGEVWEDLSAQARTAFRVAGCEGFARIDFFWDPDGRLLLNEINSIPGLTPKSMFPKAWEATGVPFHHVVRRLIDHGLERHRNGARLLDARAAAHAEETAASRPSVRDARSDRSASG